MVVPVSGEWDAKKATWNTHPEWDTEKAVYSEEFQVDKNSEVKNNVAITDSNYDGTKAIVDVTELIKNMDDAENTLSLAVCDENGYELAFASTEGAAKLDAEKEAAPVIRATVKKCYRKRCRSIQNRRISGYICRQLERRSDSRLWRKEFPAYFLRNRFERNIGNRRWK